MSTALQRVDAHDKVTGRLRYGTERWPDGLAYAVFAVATIGKGRVLSVDADAAQKVRGVQLVITRIDPDELRSPGFLMGGGYGFQSLQPLTDDRIAYRGQPIALVVADTLLAATEAADLITADYEPEPVAATLEAEGTQTVVQSQAIPMLADDADRVQVISPSVGGGFGQKNSLQPHIGPLAIAARRIGRPVKLVLMANDAANDPVTGLPWSSRYVSECLRRGSERFGWADRTPEPRSMRAPDGTLVGWGVGIGAYAAEGCPAIAKLSADAAGVVSVAVAGHEMGQGIRTAITRLVAGDLGIESAAVQVSVGDTRRVPQHLTAGSWGSATALPAVQAAVRELRARLGLPKTGPVDLRSAVTATGAPRVDVEATTVAPGQSADVVVNRLRNGLLAYAGPVFDQFVSFSYIAHFVEVHIEPTTCRIRVPRVVSVADCGRVVSPVTAASQVRGGVIWGIGAALREQSLVDPRYGGFVNPTLEEYPIVVNADVGQIDVDFVDEPDPLLNTVGVKGLGEVAMCGVAPAIANAVFHATGERFRKLPIRIEDVLASQKETRSAG